MSAPTHRSRVAGINRGSTALAGRCRRGTRANARYAGLRVAAGSTIGLLRVACACARSRALWRTRAAGTARANRTPYTGSFDAPRRSDSAIGIEPEPADVRPCIALRLGQPRLAQRLRLVALVQQLKYALGHCVVVAHVNQQAGGAVFNDVGNAASIGAHDRHT